MMVLCRRALWEHSDGVISEVELGERRQSVHWRRRDEVVAAQHETAQHELPEPAQRTRTQRVEVVVCGGGGVSLV